MMLPKSLWLHIGLLIVASGVAAKAWLADDSQQGQLEVLVWDGKAESLERIEYVAPDKQAVLTAQGDDAGRYWVVELTTTDKNSKGPHDPHGAAPKPSPEEPQVEKFIGVTSAREFATQFAPLRAVRALGEISPERSAEFGFGDADEAKSLNIQFAGQTRKLNLGASPPGGSHLYARDPESGQVYVLGGSLSGDLGALKGRLMQRAFHEFEAGEVGRVKIVSGDQSRELARFDGAGNFWSDAADTKKKDESVSNWMTQFERLSVKEYLEAPSEVPTPILKVELADALGKPLGSLQLGKTTPQAKDEKPSYFAKSETSRWWARVSSQSASQLEDDLATVLER